MEDRTREAHLILLAWFRFYSERSENEGAKDGPLDGHSVSVDVDRCALGGRPEGGVALGVPGGGTERVAGIDFHVGGKECAEDGKDTKYPEGCVYGCAHGKISLHFSTAYMRGASVERLGGGVKAGRVLVALLLM